MVLCVILGFLSAISVAFAPSFVAFVIFRAITGFCFFASYTSSFVLGECVCVCVCVCVYGCVCVREKARSAALYRVRMPELLPQQVVRGDFWAPIYVGQFAVGDGARSAICVPIWLEKERSFFMTDHN